MKFQQRNKEEKQRMNEEIEESKYMPTLPFPQKQRREKLDKRFGRFLEVLKQGASINLMPLSILRKLEGEIGEIKAIPVSLQLADQSTLIPEGIVEDELVRVEKFVFPMDFIMVNMEENWEVPLILGRPFLATGRVILDIQECQLMLRVGK
ncbi:PREDICTED: uncharacterized protein LOC109211961 [Nicotiana attenuata]|uniref:uncharacterized protein LOC109211961 n=1 Tax=Nicotiana attenuata TaxID=49451 RepID=UPI000904FB63|nr:PREDICTED: uncharacterized protein LOC109211961 [Nicotiana attenuata]